ncbi:MAG: 6-carboxytetrahydropterin synthase QueD [candidate division KSB1 bacterium]|nr:6-carboxytetrahydropterin synthase QueD [candidate division KSB1 bacterium]
MFKLIIHSGFSAAHALRGYNGVCADIHGHNWRVSVTFAAQQPDENGMVVDLVALKKAVDECVATLDHRFINEVPPFDKLNPTSENLAKYFYETLSARAPIDVLSVEVAESDDYAVVYEPRR